MLVIMVLSSCDVQRSNTTGWNYNDPDYGGFEYVDYYGQETGPGLVLIEGGTFSMGRVEQDVLYDWNNVPRRVTVSSFYMDETEIRNVDYREYMYWLKRVFATYPEVEKQARPDTNVWRSKLAYNEPYVELYLRHPAYQEYPVVGVSWVQADRYCVWRTDRVNEWILIREGLLYKDPNQVDAGNFSTDAYLANKFQEGAYRGPGIEDLDPNIDFRNVRMEDGILLPRYRLPTEAEWEFAALALIENHIDERVFHRKFFPWNGHYVRNDGQKEMGMIMANSIRGKGDMMGTAGYLNDNADITAPVDAYWPNDYGLYCMAGNVNEWVMDIYRPLTFEDMDEFRPFRGNEYRRKTLNSDGTIADKISEPQYNLTDIMYYMSKLDSVVRNMNPAEIALLDQIRTNLTVAKTKSDERKWEEVQIEIRKSVELLKSPAAEANIAPILLAEFSKLSVSMPGQLKDQRVTDEECFNRRNYNTSDNINFLDGDFESSTSYDSGTRAGHTSGKMYYQGNEAKFTPRGGNDMNSMINDRVRVYKGGSWNDRIYWMVPGTRRFLDETQARADLGFRCAMTRVGSPVGF